MTCGLRSYLPAGHPDKPLELGLESDPWEYVERLVEVFREVRRVLRSDGTCFINLGSSYSNDGKWGGSTGGKHVAALHGNSGIGRQRRKTGFKAKDLVPIPWMVAMALQADGWYLRCDIIWAKGVSFCDSYAGSVMPQSVQDRPSTSHEYLFLLSKSAHYSYDSEAVKEKAVDPDRQRNERLGGANGHTVRHLPGGIMQASATRNLRSVWTLNPEPLREAHYASYPPALVRPCILAGTSAHGVCPACQAPYKRVVERKANPQGINGGEHREPSRDGALGKRKRDYGQETKIGQSVTTGWEPTCQCNAGDPVPATILDPFCGSGTTLLVAERLGRNSIGIELSQDYCRMARKRIEEDAPLFYQTKEAP